MKEKHEYSSRLRQEQMERTREQIMEALIRVMANGIAEVSVPAVAREAAVSIPTVYRHFRTKRDLIQALGSYTFKKLGVNSAEYTFPRSPEEFASMVRDTFTRYGEIDETMRVAAMSEFAYEARKEGLPMRLKIVEDALALVRSHFNEADWIRLRNIMFILSTTATVRAFKDYLNLDGEQAADSVVWAIQMLAQATSAVDKTDQPDQTTPEH